MVTCSDFQATPQNPKERDPDHADHLLSSSVFKDHPTKLDLTLADIDFLFLHVLRPLLEIQLSVFAATPLETDLLREWRQARIAVKDEFEGCDRSPIPSLLPGI